MPYGWFYPKNSILKPIVDEIFHRLMQGGIFDRQEEIEPFCAEDQFVPVDFDFVTVFFVILSVGIPISILTFCMEICKYHLLCSLSISRKKTSIFDEPTTSSEITKGCET